LIKRVALQDEAAISISARLRYKMRPPSLSLQGYRLFYCFPKTVLYSLGRGCDSKSNKKRGEEVDVEASRYRNTGVNMYGFLSSAGKGLAAKAVERKEDEERGEGVSSYHTTIWKTSVLSSTR
jgi:hypothetical protein